MHMPSKPLPIQVRILRFLKNYPHQYPPTVREIGQGVGLNSASSVQAHLELLEVMGYISREPNTPRSIVLLKEVQ